MSCKAIKRFKSRKNLDYLMLETTSLKKSKSFTHNLVLLAGSDEDEESIEHPMWKKRSYDLCDNFGHHSYQLTRQLNQPQSDLIGFRTNSFESVSRDSERSREKNSNMLEVLKDITIDSSTFETQLALDP